MAQLADYAMIANSIKDDLRTPADNEQQQNTIANIAAQTQGQQLKNDAMKTDADANSSLKASVKKNAIYDPASGKVNIDHEGVVRDLTASGRSDLAYSYQVDQHAKELEKLSNDNKFAVNSLAAAMQEPDINKKNQIWQYGIQHLKSQGHDMTGIPEQYDETVAKQMYGQALGAEQLAKQHIEEIKAQTAAAREADYSRSIDAKSAKGMAEDNVFLATPGGYIAANKNTGATRTLMDENGQPYIPVGADIGLRRDLAGASASGKEQAENVVKAKQALPLVESNADMIEKQIKEVLSHPGRDAATGAYSLAPAIPGTQQGAFVSRLNQIKGDAFLQAFQSLKGAGAITDIEGKKAGEALSRMDRGLEKSEFDAAAKDFLEIVKHGRERARAEAAGKTYEQGGSGKGAMTPAIAPTGKPSLNDIFGNK